MTASHKKWAALGAVLLVLGVGAAVFMQQTAGRVEAEVRAALAGLPGLTEHSVDRVQYDFFGQTLTLKNVHLVFKDKEGVTDVAMGEVVAVKPNPNALKGGAAGTLLADDVRVAQYVVSATTVTPPTQAQSRVDSMRLTKPQADIPGLMNLVMINGKPLDAAKGLKALSSLKVDAVSYTGLSVDVTSPELPSIRMTLDSMDARDVTVSYTGWGALKNWVLDIKGMGKASIALLEATALTVPDLSKLPPEALFSPASLAGKPSEADVQALLTAVENNLPKDKPMLGKLTIQDVKESFSGGNISLQRFTVDDFWYEPKQMGLTLEGLSVPAHLLPTPVIAMLGYKRLNISGDASLRPRKDKVLQLTASVDTQDAGKVQLNMEMKDPTAGASALGAMDNLLLNSLTLKYTDAGLAGRAAVLAQGALGLTPPMIVELARASAAEVVGNRPEDIAQFMNFVQKPGEITFSLTPTKPTPLNQIEQVDPASLRVTSVPGPKTLQELTKP